jgi:protein-S-isoprenylcysteine O-methyltransferase Ste14
MDDAGKSAALFHTLLRPVFGLCLFLSQFTARRGAFFSKNPYLLALGAAFILVAAALWTAAGRHLSAARDSDGIATGGPFRYVRHPIYASIYVLCLGLGLAFFAWLWFAVMAAFIPWWIWECRREECEMIALHGERYLDYMSRTGMVLPRVI